MIKKIQFLNVELNQWGNNPFWMYYTDITQIVISSEDEEYYESDAEPTNIRVEYRTSYGDGPENKAAFVLFGTFKEIRKLEDAMKDLAETARYYLSKKK